MEKLAHYMDKEEKIWVKLIVSAHVLERISQGASTPLVVRHGHVFGDPVLVLHPPRLTNPPLVMGLPLL